MEEPHYTVLTAREFISGFLSPGYEKAPWVMHHIDKDDTIPSFDENNFDENTNRLKSAWIHVSQYDNKDEHTAPQASGVPKFEDLADDIISQPDDETDSNNSIDEIRYKYMKEKHEPIRDYPANFSDIKNQQFRQLIKDNSEILFGLDYYQEQVYFVLHLTDGKKQRQIAQFFGVCPGTIYQHNLRRCSEKQKVGAPRCLNNEQLIAVNNFIQEKYSEKNYPTIYTVLHFIFDTFDKSINSDTLLKFLREKEIAFSAIANPLDSRRSAVQIEDIKEYYFRLTEFLNYHCVPDTFILNTDESGFQPFANAKAEHVILPIGAPTKDLCYPVNRQRKRSTLIATVFGDGSRLESVVIITRSSIEAELYYYGYRPNNGYHFVSQENGFITSDIWDFWADTCLFPEILRRRELFQYNGPVVLLIDGCSSHFSEYFLEECLFYGIVVFYEPPDSSDQLQVLDIGLFGIQKKTIKKVNVRKDFNEQSKELIKIINSWEAAASRSNICSAFEQAGFSKYQKDIGSQTFYMKVDINNAIRIRDLNASPVVHGEDYKKRIKINQF